MLLIEFKKSIHNKMAAYILAITGVAFLLGWVLPVGIDQVESLTYADYIFSTYTVFTQFGFLLFSFGTAYFFNKEYHDKTIIFYQCFKFNSLKLYLSKLFVVLVEEIISLLVYLVIISTLFKSTEFYFDFLLLFTGVVFQYFMITGIISMLFENMLISIGISILYWLVSVIFVTFGGIWKNFAVFDASNDLYVQINRYLVNDISVIPMENIRTILVELIALFCITILIASLINSRWKKIGV